MADVEEKKREGMSLGEQIRGETIEETVARDPDISRIETKEKIVEEVDGEIRTTPKTRPKTSPGAAEPETAPAVDEVTQIAQARAEKEAAQAQQAYDLAVEQAQQAKQRLQSKFNTGQLPYSQYRAELRKIEGGLSSRTQQIQARYEANIETIQTNYETSVSIYNRLTQKQAQAKALQKEKQTSQASEVAYVPPYKTPIYTQASTRILQTAQYIEALRGKPPGPEERILANVRQTQALQQQPTLTQRIDLISSDIMAWRIPAFQDLQQTYAEKIEKGQEELQKTREFGAGLYKEGFSELARLETRPGLPTAKLIGGAVIAAGSAAGQFGLSVLRPVQFAKSFVVAALNPIETGKGVISRFKSDPVGESAIFYTFFKFGQRSFRARRALKEPKFTIVKGQQFYTKRPAVLIEETPAFLKTPKLKGGPFRSGAYSANVAEEISPTISTLTRTGKGFKQFTIAVGPKGPQYTTITRQIGKTQYTIRSVTQATGKTTTKIFRGQDLIKTARYKAAPQFAFTAPQTILQTKQVVKTPGTIKEIVTKIKTSEAVKTGRRSKRVETDLKLISVETQTRAGAIRTAEQFKLYQLYQTQRGLSPKLKYAEIKQPGLKFVKYPEQRPAVLQVERGQISEFIPATYEAQQTARIKTTISGYTRQRPRFKPLGKRAQLTPTLDLSTIQIKRADLKGIQSELSFYGPTPILRSVALPPVNVGAVALSSKKSLKRAASPRINPILDQPQKPAGIQRDLRATKEIQSELPAQAQISRQLPTQAPGLGQIPIQAQKPAQKQRQAPQQAQRPAQATPQIPIQAQRPAFPAKPTPPQRPAFARPGPAAPLPPPIPPLFLSDQRAIQPTQQQKEKKLKQPLEYKPTATAAIIGIKGTPTQFDIKTGLGIRPIRG